MDSAARPIPCDPALAVDVLDPDRKKPSVGAKPLGVGILHSALGYELRGLFQPAKYHSPPRRCRRMDRPDTAGETPPKVLPGEL